MKRLRRSGSRSSRCSLSCCPSGWGSYLPFVAGGLVAAACAADDAGRGEAPPELNGAPSGAVRLVRSESPAVAPYSRTEVVPFLTNGQPALPKWKTRWEREAERVKQTGAGGLMPIDQFDDYRQLHVKKFFVTQPPASKVRLPAEYEASQALLLQWTSGLGAARDKIYTDMIKGAWGVVPVVLIYVSNVHRTAMENKLKLAGLDPSDNAKVTFWPHKLNSIWVRDSGPIGILSVPGSGPAKVSFVDPHYYHARIYDDELPSDLAEAWGINVFRPDINFEGGNFMSTSDGLCAASAGVLAFNPQLTQSAVEEMFAEYFGCKTTIFPQWLKGEGTTHIDMYAKFTSDTTVLVGEYTAAQDAQNKQILDDVAKLFKQTPNGSGQPVKVIRIPMPNNRKGTQKIWRTYTNSISLTQGTQKVVLIPTYNEEPSGEAAAMAAYGQAFPGWKLIKIPSDAIIIWGGAIHCITMQVPSGQQSKMESAPKDKCGATKVSCDSCGNVTGQGCCDGDVLKYCNNQGKLVVLGCGSDPQCGWNGAKNWYDCGTSGTTDPGGLPKSCAAIPDASVSPADAGIADAGKNSADSGAGKPCGAVQFQGCCDGETLNFCENGTLKQLDCSGAPQCGWKSQGGFYDCGSSGGSDPNGLFPKACNGAALDAGALADAGVVGPDVGQGASDASLGRDGGVVDAPSPSPDMTTPPRDARSNDGASPLDAAPDSGAASKHPEGGGCQLIGSPVSRGGTSLGWILLLAVCIVTRQTARLALRGRQ